MSKKYLEALDRLAMPDELHIKECEKLGIGLTEDYDLIKNTLHRLVAIDNAEPSEALERLEDLRKQVSFANSDGCIFDNIYDNIIKDIETIKQTLIGAKKNKEAIDALKWVFKSGFLLAGSYIDPDYFCLMVLDRDGKVKDYHSLSENEVKAIRVVMNDED